MPVLSNLELLPTVIKWLSEKTRCQCQAPKARQTWFETVSENDDECEDVITANATKTKQISRRFLDTLPIMRLLLVIRVLLYFLYDKFNL